MARGGEVFCDIQEGPGLQEGVSPHKVCISERFPDFVDYQFNIPSCTVLISMTQIGDTTDLERAMRPGFSQYTQGLPSPPCPEDGSAIFRFQEVDAYGYGQLSAWAGIAVPRIRAAVPQTRGSLILDGRLHIHFGTDAAAEEAREILNDVGVPPDAYDLTSRETEIREIPSIAPRRLVISGREALLLPVLLPSNEKAGEVVLGQTTLAEVLAILPPQFGQGPIEAPAAPKSQRAPWLSKKIQKSIDKVRIQYSPTPGYVFMGFDQSNRLIVLSHEVQEGQEESLSSALSALSNLAEVHRSGGRAIRRGDIGSCVTVETTTVHRAAAESRLAGACYFYTCPTPK